MFDHIHASNFDIAAGEFYKDLLIGTAAMVVTGTDDEPLIFSTIPLSELYFLPGPLGSVDKVFRKYKIAVGNIESTWSDATITSDLRDLINDKPDEEIEIIEGALPKKIKILNVNTNIEEEIDGFGYYVCCEKYDGYIVERDTPVNPFIVARWGTLSGETWGRGHL